LATLNEVIAGGMIGWVLEADLKNFCKHPREVAYHLDGLRKAGLPAT
jgi:hypothetical protein